VIRLCLRYGVSPVFIPKGGPHRASAHFYDDLVNFAALRPLV
jgi:hypothetical protein